MKKRMLIFSGSILLFSSLSMSYSTGPITQGQGNHTGSQGTAIGCAGGGCHGANNTNTTIIISLTDTVTNTIVLDGWQPGKTYRLDLSGVNSAMTKYGFQLSAVRDSGSVEVQAGTFSGAPGNTAIKPSGNLLILEHTAKLNVTGFYNTSIFWTSPSIPGVDTIEFYATVNAVNDDNTAGGDQPNSAKKVYTPNTTSVATLSADIKIATYPNPVTDKLNISLENAGSGTYSIRVFDMNGKVVANQTATVNKSYSTSINTAAWANGMYHVQLQKDGAQRTIAVVKQ